jgi:transketolase
VTELSNTEVAELVAASREVRLRVLDMFVRNGKGHFGGCFSVTEILVTLYAKILRVNAAVPDWPDRDRLILSKGHANAALCAVLGQYGFLDPADLVTYGQFGSRFGMHVDMHLVPGCDMSAGSLGHGLAAGLGMAVAGRADHKDYRVYVVLGDGECDEGSVWEAALVASHHNAENLTAIVDRNKISQCGFTEEILRLEPFAEKWRSFGWHVIEVDGHDVRQLHAGLQEARETRGKPTVLVAATVKGKGVSFMEGNPAYHSGGLAGEHLAMAKAELESAAR